MKRLNGFSLVEIFVVLGIIVLLAGLTAAVATPAIRGSEFDRVRETLRNELTAAQMDSISGTSDSAWGVSISSNALTRYKGASYATRVPIFDRVTTFSNAVVLSGTSDIAFTRPFGLPVTSSTIIMTDGQRSAVATVTTAGVISVQ